MSRNFQRRSYVLSLKVGIIILIYWPVKNVKYFKILIKHMNDENVKKSFITRESEILDPATLRKDKQAIVYIIRTVRH